MMKKDEHVENISFTRNYKDLIAPPDLRVSIIYTRIPQGEDARAAANDSAMTGLLTNEEVL